MAKRTAKTSSIKTTKAKTTTSSSAASIKAAKTAKATTKKVTAEKKVAKKKVTTKKVVAKKTTKTAKKVAKRTAAAPSASNGRVRKPLKSTPLSDKDLDFFHQLLLDKRHELTGDLDHMEAEVLKRNRQDASGDLSSMPIHMADVGTDNYEQEFTLGLLQGEQQLLADIDASLDRIKHRQYGICMGTGKAITKARLKAKPWAEYCIEYARLLEKGLAPPPIDP